MGEQTIKLKHSHSVYFRFQPDLYIYKPLMNDRDEIADQREKHAQLSWYESKETFQTRFKWKDRMGKTRVLFKKIKDTKGTFHAKVGTIKDINHIE